jgi:hypothetical protein
LPSQFYMSLLRSFVRSYMRIPPVKTGGYKYSAPTERDTFMSGPRRDFCALLKEIDIIFEGIDALKL